MMVLEMLLILSILQVPVISSHIKQKSDPHVTFEFSGPRDHWFFQMHKVQAFSVAVNSLCILMITIKQVSD